MGQMLIQRMFLHAGIGGAAAVAGLAALLTAPPPVAAHGAAAPIEIWGSFLPATQTCLRTISRATHACFDAVLALEQACHDAPLHGAVCDQERLAADVSAADGALRRTLVDACEDGQLTELGYIGLLDAGADLTQGCSGEAQGAVAALYAPRRAGATSVEAARCMAAVAAYARKALWFARQRKVPVMERIATRLFTAAEKQAAIVAVNRELRDARARWAAGLLRACPAFEAVYGRTPDSLLQTLGQRVDCTLSRTYVHSAMSCLAPICGNGIPEDSEACDDGNAVDGADGCRNDCTAP